MNKAELIQKYHAFVEHVGCDVEDVVLGAGGAMLLHGLREETADLDIAVSYDVYFTLIRRGYPTKANSVYPDADAIVEYSNDVDVHLIDTVRATEIVDGVCYLTVKSILIQKLEMDRPKDQADIVRLCKVVLEDTEVKS